MSYKSKLAFYLFLLFAAYATVDVCMQMNREKRYQTENYVSNLESYAEVAENFLRRRGDTASVETLLPEHLRMTIVGAGGDVLFDNRGLEDLDNHSLREEIVSARRDGSGYAIRRSASDDVEYLYLARRMRSGDFVRIAMPYSIHFGNFLRGDNVFFYLVILLFVISIYMVIHQTEKFGKVMTSLQKFVTSVSGGQVDYSTISFPETGAGAIGQNVVSLYEQLEKKRRQVDDEKSKNRRMKHEMTNNIAHELRTPVSSIRGYLEILLGDAPLTDEKRRYFMQRSYAQTLRLSELIDDISLLTKMEDASLLFQKEKLDIAQVCREAEADLEFLLQENKMQISNNLPDGMFVSGNKMLLYSIFRNLIENAAKYAGEGASVSVDLLGRDGDTFRLSVSDTGRGVEEENLRRIFDRFVRIDDGRSRATGGSGLGLSIVKHAVLFHGGEISAHNRPGGGLEFRFSLCVKNS